MTDDKKQVGRVAFRHEGNLWNAYYALTDTMEGALHLGSIQMAAVQDPSRKQAFMDIMQSFVGDIIEDCAGARPHFPAAQSAPEHERAGHS